MTEKLWSPWEPRVTLMWCCSLCLQFGHSASSIAPGRKISESSNFFLRIKSFLALHLLVPNRESWRVWQVPRQRIRREWQSQTEKSVCSKNYLATLTWDYLVTHTWVLSSAIFASTFSSFSMSAVAKPRSHSCWFWEASKECEIVY